MSHLKERAEKVCLNCNTALSGRFCHICGQENIEPKETVWHLVTHFFNDITHFDGKFFSSLSSLVRKPGFLSRQYALGRRAAYLNPIRMYIFTSAVFFLIFFSIFHITEESIDHSLRIGDKTLDEIRSMKADSLRNFTAAINNGVPVAPAALDEFLDSVINTEGFHLTGHSYRSRTEYDSLLKAGVKKHNWLQRRLIYREIEANQQFHNSGKAFLTSFISAFIHRFPQMLFISLPLFALFLQLLYRRKKDYYYVSHGIFSIHFYIFVFITLLVIMGLGLIRDLLHWEWLIFFQRLLGAVIFYYLYKAMRNFYLQSRGKTIVKFILLCTLSMGMIVLLFLTFILFSFMKI